MRKLVVDIKNSFEHKKGYWIVPFNVARGGCSSCPPLRKAIIIEQDDKPTQIQIRNRLIIEGYEIKN